VLDDVDVVKTGLTQILRRAGAVIVELPAHVPLERADLGSVDLVVLGPDHGRTAVELVTRLASHGYRGRVLVLVRGVNLREVQALVGSGADGVARLASSEHALLEVGVRVLDGERVIADVAPQHLMSALRATGERSSLTRREREVLALLATNRTLAEVGAELMVSVGTVKRHTSHIYGKLGVRSRRDAVERAFAARLLDVVS